jgi:hypothetical protein
MRKLLAILAVGFVAYQLFKKRGATKEFIEAKTGEIMTTANSGPLPRSAERTKRPEKKKSGVTPPSKMPPLPEGPLWEAEEQTPTDPEDLPRKK